MLTYPYIDPVALSLGPLKIHWYGVMYLTAFTLAWLLGKSRAKNPAFGWQVEQVSDLIFYGAIGVILGGRIGYVLFYDFANYISNPLSILKIWQGGMSFHGGLIGVIIALWLFSKKAQKTFFEVSDFLVPLFPLGYAAGRIGNFINGELWGKVTDVPWAMVFPHVGPEPRHPSQIYQAFLGGFVTFAIFWIYTKKPRPTKEVSGAFLIVFGCYRIFVEFFRQPDAHIGYLAFDWLTVGQLLSLPMIFGGLGLVWWSQQTVSIKKDKRRKV